MRYRGKGFFLLALAVTPLAGGTAEADVLTVNGDVATTLTLNDAALGGTSVSATIGGVVYSGSSVYSLINDAGFESDPAQSKNGNLLDYLTITSATGQTVVLSEGQIDPSFGGQASNPQDFIATSANGSPIAPRLIVQSDPNGTTDGYDITGVTSVTVGFASMPTLTTSALNNPTSFTVTGNVASPPVTYSTSTFSSVFPIQTTQTDNYLSMGNPTTKTFTGVSIWSLLQNAGMLADASDPQSIFDGYIVVTATNEPTMGAVDYGVVYSLGELDPAFNAFTATTGPVPLIAEISGPAFRSTAPSDSFGGRYNTDVVNISVDAIPEPGSLALMLPPLVLLFAFGRRLRGWQA